MFNRFCDCYRTCVFVGERRKSNHQRREVVEIKRERKNVAMVLAEKRKLRGEMMTEMNERRRSALAAEEVKIEMMAEQERDMNDENRTVMTKEGKTERGNAMTEERKKILVEGRTEGEREKKLRETEGTGERKKGEIEGERAQRKETERREGETETEREIEKGIGTEGEETRGDNIQSAKLISYTLHCHTTCTISCVLIFLLIIRIQ